MGTWQTNDSFSHSPLHKEVFGIGRHYDWCNYRMGKHASLTVMNVIRLAK